MAVTYAFDVYGTLVNTNVIQEALVRLVGDNAPLLMDAWRSKQLEYSFRRGFLIYLRELSVPKRYKTSNLVRPFINIF